MWPTVSVADDRGDTTGTAELNIGSLNAASQVRP